MPQCSDGGGVARRLGSEQVNRDPFKRCPAGEQRTRRGEVRSCAPAGFGSRKHGAADDRMRELKRSLVIDQPGARQLIGGAGRLLGPQARDLGDEQDVAGLLEHRECTGESTRIGTDPSEDRPRQRLAV